MDGFRRAINPSEINWGSPARLCYWQPRLLKGLLVCASPWRTPSAAAIRDSPPADGNSRRFRRDNLWWWSCLLPAPRGFPV